MKNELLNENQSDTDNGEDENEVPSRVHEWRPCLRLNAALDIGEVEPDFYAAEVGAFGADRGGDVGAEVAGRTDVFGELRVDVAELGNFVHAGGVDFFLGVEAGAHGPFVEEMEEGAGLDEADGFGVREKVESDFW
jgi:hypothetical protein